MVIHQVEPEVDCLSAKKAEGALHWLQATERVVVYLYPILKKLPSSSNTVQREPIQCDLRSQETCRNASLAQLFFTLLDLTRSRMNQSRLLIATLMRSLARAQLVKGQHY